MTAPTKPARDSADDRSFEYRFGEAIEKSAKGTLQGVLQALLGALFDAEGCRVACGVDLRIDPNWQPIPDIVVSRFAIESPYPTKPVELVAEILSPNDPMSRLFEKCRNYQRIGIQTVLVFDPESHMAWEWDGTRRNLEPLYVITLPNGRTIPIETVWQKLDEQLA